MTRPTTGCSRGDVVLVRFVFADEKGAKQRPALVISADGYHRGRREAILAAVTSCVDRILPGDHELVAWQQTGLLAPSVVTGIIRTIKRDMIVRKMGVLGAADLDAVEIKLRESLALQAR
jgi:mRNA-degrading endonuclease toxin of MazEF toxin-antitoxin module